MNYEEILSSMKARYRELSGFDADQASDIGIRLKVLAAEAAGLYEKIGALRSQIFPQTSTGEYLELHAATRAITRKPAIRAQGTLRFFRETPAYSDIAIPAGILCSTRPEPQVHFETTQDVVLAAGEFFADVPAEAVEAGAPGNVAANAVCVMVSPAGGVTGVTNPGQFSGGVDEENDDMLRSRLLAAYQNISNGTNGAFYYDLAMSHEGVSSANVLPRRRGRGTVDVVVACRSEDSQDEIVAAIQEDLIRRKEINVDVLVTAAICEYTAVSVEIAVKDGHNFPIVAEKAREEIISCINGLGVGEPLLLAATCSRVLTVDGVYNYRVLLPQGDILPLRDRVLRPGNVTVSRMAVG